MITITLEGNGFLKQMVRNIVGTLVDVGRGRTSVAQFRRILASKDRRAAGTAKRRARKPTSNRLLQPSRLPKMNNYRPKRSRSVCC